MNEIKDREVDKSQEKLRYALRGVNASYIVTKANEIKQEDLVLFVSFDLVNSTRFKSYNYLNWFNIIYEITDKIREGVKAIDTNFQLWRSIGDEVVFTIVVSNRNKIEALIDKVFKLLNNIHLDIKNGEIFKNSKTISEMGRLELVEQNILSIKATAWIALVSNNIEKNELKYNVRYDYYVADNVKVVEFQGNDIDTGFRISKKCTNPRRLALSLELAYILSESKYVKSKLHIITYDKLKGVWDNRLYPVIWYHDEYTAGCTLDNSFFYDEEEQQELVKRFKATLSEKDNYRNKDVNLIFEQIISDRNLFSKIKRIDDKLDENSDCESSKALELPSEFIEMHCVAVCLNDENKIFMAQRSDTSDIYEGLWEFGCCEITQGLTFKKALTDGYKREFNMDIEVEKPFRDYSFSRGNITIPGIRYKARVRECKDIRLSENYKDYKFVSIEEFMNMRNDVIDFDDFKEIFEEILTDK